jgi:hypothetical protein
VAKTQRTINPLHFEDLEPHRFEDLIRQLAYRYRSWRYLDATGRLGRDQGVDIRGVEMVSTSRNFVDVAVDDDGDEVAEQELGIHTVDEREWRIQCKRYKEIGPKLMREVVAEAVTNPDEAPYGLIIAAACDVSAETMAVCREEALARGVIEVHLWTKAHLEDLLFLPENDHLLFAYFGISLGVRRRSQLQRLRETITLKRKILRAFKETSVHELRMKDALIRDINDNNFPYRKKVPGYWQMRCPPWHGARIEYLTPQGLLVWRFGFEGWVKDDGSWDILEESCQPPARAVDDYWYDYDEDDHSVARQKQAKAWDLAKKVPENEKKYVQEMWLIPFEFILEIDPIGNILVDEPHIYCRFDGDEGPYAGPARYSISSGYSNTRLEIEKRKPLFEELKASLSNEAQESDASNEE